MPAVWASPTDTTMSNAALPNFSASVFDLLRVHSHRERTREVLYGTGFVFEAKMNDVVLIQGVRRLSGSK